MTNYKIGIYSAASAGLSTAIFALSMLSESMLNISFFTCMVLSWSYIVLSCAFAAQADPTKKVFAFAGVAFACLYAAFINLVYFTQLTVVTHQSASKELLDALTFTPGSWLFSLDIFGYGIMAISTFFIGLSIIPSHTSDKWLKVLLMLHGIFAPVSVAFPMLNLFQSTESVESGSNMGVIALEGWCLFFMPMMALSVQYFKKAIESGNAESSD